MKSSNRESGFTLLELMVTCALLTLLVAIAVPELRAFREEASYAVAEQTLHDARTALAAGLIDEESLTNVVVVHQFVGGEISTPAGRQLFPGFSVPDSTHFFAMYNPFCRMGMCFREYVRVRNCEANKYLYYARLGDGTELTITDIHAGWSC